MLYYKTIYPKTLELLKQISATDYFNEFALAGGTSLSLQIGHRLSYDLDFFGQKKIDSIEILNNISVIAKPTIIHQTQNILILNINDIKVDFVNYNYPLLKKVIFKDDLRLVAIEDIAAMKLAAIAGRGKKRDFFDVFEILKYYTLNEILEFYRNKYEDGSEFLVLKSLTYFDDANLDADLKLFNNVTWETVKKQILKAVREIS